MPGKVHDFEELTPQVILEAVEEVSGRYLSGSIFTLPSYINRVFELKTEENQSLIAKFYRPGRWNLDAIQEEHQFIQECAEAEIPVIPPLSLKSGGTLGRIKEIPFALYPKKAGRELDWEDDDGLFRLGSLIGRMHIVSARSQARHRTRIDPALSLEEDIRFLLSSGLIPGEFLNPFEETARKIQEKIIPLFRGVEMLRLHGDCHRGNILHRPGEGLMLIDFDDMATGPAVQDLWLFLPGHVQDCRRELNIILEGYEEFRTLDRETIHLIEPLRAMRLIYFLAWCARQVNDPRFYNQFAHWQERDFWAREIRDLAHQLEMIK